jgi:hypothetical protein
VLLFSSNFRQFQLDAGGMTGLQHEDISRQTLPRRPGEDLLAYDRAR